MAKPNADTPLYPTHVMSGSVDNLLFHDATVKQWKSKGYLPAAMTPDGVSGRTMWWSERQIHAIALLAEMASLIPHVPLRSLAGKAWFMRSRRPHALLFTFGQVWRECRTPEKLLQGISDWHAQDWSFTIINCAGIRKRVELTLAAHRQFYTAEWRRKQKAARSAVNV